MDTHLKRSFHTPIDVIVGVTPVEIKTSFQSISASLFKIAGIADLHKPNGKVTVVVQLKYLTPDTPDLLLEMSHGELKALGLKPQDYVLIKDDFGKKTQILGVTKRHAEDQLPVEVDAP